MNNVFSVYVPSTTDINTPIDNEQIVKRVLKLFSLRFGGASSESLTGAWYSDSLNDVVVEPITRVYAYSDTASAQDKAFVRVVAHAVKTWLAQEAVAYEIFEYAPDNGMQFA